MIKDIEDIEGITIYLIEDKKFINKKMDEIQKDLQELRKKNMELEQKNEMPNTKKTEEDIKQNNIPLKTIENYIMANINEGISIDDIAYEIGYNSSYIIRSFKKKYGLSPHAYIMNKKINCAENLLSKNTEQSVSDIAYEFGFCDQSHFIKNFKRVFGISPNTYK